MAQQIVYRSLDGGHANAVHAIEQEIIRRQPKSLKHIHVKTPEELRALLSGGSDTSFIGAFAVDGEDEKLVGYGAYTLPENILELHNLDEQLVDISTGRRVSIPASGTGPTGGLYLLRVHPDYQGRNIGTQLVSRRLRDAFDRGAAFLLTDVKVSNAGTLRAQAKVEEFRQAADEATAPAIETTALIWAAGYDEAVEYVPCLTMLHLPVAACGYLQEKQRVSTAWALGEGFHTFAAILDAGYVAKRSREVPETMVIYQRPEGIGEARAKGEATAVSMDGVLAHMAKTAGRAPNTPKMKP